MQGRNRTLSILGGLLIFLGLACSFSAGEKHSEQEVQKTDRLNKIIAEHFPAYSVIQTKDIDKYVTDFYAQQDIGDSPGIVQADFNGDEINDYALVLHGKNADVTPFAKFVILFCEASHCRIILQEDISNYAGTVILDVVAPGTTVYPTEAFDTGSTPTKLSYSGIEVKYVGAAAIVYFWDEESRAITTIQTID